MVSLLHTKLSSRKLQKATHTGSGTLQKWQSGCPGPCVRGTACRDTRTCWRQGQSVPFPDLCHCISTEALLYLLLRKISNTQEVEKHIVHWTCTHLVSKVVKFLILALFISIHLYLSIYLSIYLSYKTISTISWHSILRHHVPQSSDLPTSKPGPFPLVFCDMAFSPFFTSLINMWENHMQWLDFRGHLIGKRDTQIIYGSLSGDPYMDHYRSKGIYLYIYIPVHGLAVMGYLCRIGSGLGAGGTTPRYSSNMPTMHLPQGLCTGWFLCLEHSTTQISTWFILSPPASLCWEVTFSFSSGHDPMSHGINTCIRLCTQQGVCLKVSPHSLLENAALSVCSLK